MGYLGLLKDEYGFFKGRRTREIGQHVNDISAPLRDTMWKASDQLKFFLSGVLMDPETRTDYLENDYELIPGVPNRAMSAGIGYGILYWSVKRRDKKIKKLESEIGYGETPTK